MKPVSSFNIVANTGPFGRPRASDKAAKLLQSYGQHMQPTFYWRYADWQMTIGYINVTLFTQMMDACMRLWPLRRTSNWRCSALVRPWMPWKTPNSSSIWKKHLLCCVWLELTLPKHSNNTPCAHQMVFFLKYHGNQESSHWSNLSHDFNIWGLRSAITTLNVRRLWLGSEPVKRLDNNCIGGSIQLKASVHSRNIDYGSNVYLRQWGTVYLRWEWHIKRPNSLTLLASNSCADFSGNLHTLHSLPIKNFCDVTTS